MKRYVSLIFILILLCVIMGCKRGSVYPTRKFKATKVYSGTNENLNAIWKNYDYGNLYAVGDNGVILSSSEPETEWTVEDSPTKANLYDIAGDRGTYYAVGNDSAGKNISLNMMDIIGQLYRVNLWF